MIGRLLDLLIVAATAALLVAMAGGLDVEIGALRIAIRDWTRPAVLLAIAVTLAIVSALAGHDRGRQRNWFGLLLVAIVVAAAGVYVAHHIRVAGGLDSYGYVSTARLIAAGRLSDEQPLANVLPFETALDAATPLGHVPRADGAASVPRFPIGLPLVMAAFTTLGPEGPFFVPLVMAFAALLLVYRLSFPIAPIEPTAHIAPVLASCLLAIDPLFAAYAMQPMSDVPATCWLLAALPALHPRERTGRLFLYGVAGGMAVLTRPALLPAVALLAILAWDRTRPKASAAFAVAVGSFVAVQAALNVWMYGGATLSGYGTASHMFELSGERLFANASNFGKWLTYSHTPLFWALWPGSLIVLRRDPAAWRLSSVAAMAAAPYLFYLVFDDWESSRFLLPSIAIVFILTGRAVAVVGGQLRRRSVELVVCAAALVCAVASHRFLEREGIYRLTSLEAKYPLVGDWFRKNTSDRVVVLSSLHSGTIRMYGDRQTVRWDEIPPSALNATLRQLITAGFEPYLALDEPSEPAAFDERFNRQPLNTVQVARIRVVNIYRFVSAY